MWQEQCTTCYYRRMQGSVSSMCPTVTILGNGHVGLATGAVFATLGIKTYVVDSVMERLEIVQRGKSFFYEAGIDPLVHQAVTNGMLIATPQYAEAVPQSDIIISAVGTPDKPDGSTDLSFVFAAAEEAMQYLKPDAVYVQKSTVPVGTGAVVQKLFSDHGYKNTYLSNPSFLREGTTITDILWPGRIVIGSNDQVAVQRLVTLNDVVLAGSSTVAKRAGLPIQEKPTRYMIVSRESAELIKVSANSLLAAKVSFTNSIAQLADKAGANIVEVMNAVGADSRIGYDFLQAGRGYGGGCFPKDVKGLVQNAVAFGVDLPIMRAVDRVNEAMPAYIVRKAESASNGLTGKQVAVLGLSFKPGTSDVRCSPAITIARLLAQAGANVRAYDPQANEEAAPELDKTVTICSSLEEASAKADVVCMATDWPEFVMGDLGPLADMMRGDILVDCMNAYDPEVVRSAGLRYVGIGSNNG
jgi:UDPglucose 6-dehydrogenase